MTRQKASKAETLGRALYYGGIQRQGENIGALLASAISPDITLGNALRDAKSMGFEGTRTQQVQQDNPSTFQAGELAGNVIGTLAPSSLATKGIAATAPILAKAPAIGKALAGTATAIGEGKGLIGVPLQGAVQGAVSTGLTDADPTSGGIAGAISNSLFGVGGKLLKPIADSSISAARKGYTNVLKQAGIDDLTPAQLTGNKNLEIIDSVLNNIPFTAGAGRKKAEGQLRKFTQEAMSKAGITADEFSPAVREAAEQGFDDSYTNLLKDEVINIDQKVVSELGDVALKEIDKLPTTTKGIVQSYIKDVLQAGGQISGPAYQAARSKLRTQAAGMVNSDPTTASVLRTIKKSLDDAAGRSITPAKLPEWQKLNRNYGNYKTLQKAGSRVSQDSLEGLISPSALMSAVETANKTKSQAGYGDLYELARAGRSVLADSVPDSGTAQRQLTQQLLTGGAVGAGTYGATSDPQSALIGAAGAVALPKLIQKGLNSKAAQAYFSQGVPFASLLTSGGNDVGNVIAAQAASQENRAMQPQTMEGIPLLPEGAVLLEDGGNIPPLPEGAVLIDDTQDMPPLPEGAVLLEDSENTSFTTPMSEVNAPFLHRVAQAESGGNPNARNPASSASGMYQFTDPTWRGMVDKYGAQTGITINDKANPQAQQIMAELLMQENANAYKQAGFEPNDADLYTAHFLGAPAAVKAKANPQAYGAQLFPQAAKANPNIFYANGRPRTNQEINALLGKKVGI